MEMNSNIIQNIMVEGRSVPVDTTNTLVHVDATDTPVRVDTKELRVKEENLSENEIPIDSLNLKEEIPITNIITIRIRKKKGTPRRAEPFYLYTPEMFQSLFGFSVYQCHGDAEWKQVLKLKSGSLHFKSNGTRIHDLVPKRNFKPRMIKQGPKKKKRVNIDRSKVDGSKFQKDKAKVKTQNNEQIKINDKNSEKQRVDHKNQNGTFSAAVETLDMAMKQESHHPEEYVIFVGGNKPHQCRGCTYRASSRAHTISHVEQVHLKVRHYKCDQCDLAFYRPTARTKHIEAVHLKLKAHACNQCKATFATKTSRNRHLTTHESTGRYECPVCGKRIRHSTTFREHLDIHNKVKYSCARCDIDYSSKKTLRLHLLKHDPFFVPQIKCSNCDKLFANTALRKKHEALAHARIKYTCTLCGKSFPLSAHLKRHMINVHMNQNERLFTCDTCGTKHKTGQHLRAHFSAMHKNTFMCAHCPEKFTNKQRIENHTRKHMARAIQRPFNCDRCKKKFTYLKGLRRHIRECHLTKKHVPNLSCAKCGKHYERKGCLVKHEIACK